jgi:hypothetical protein
VTLRFLIAAGPRSASDVDLPPLTVVLGWTAAPKRR